MNGKVVIFSLMAATLAVPALAQGSGADIYKANCAMCHGPDGTSNTPVGKAFHSASFKDPAVVKTPDATLAKVIKNGKDKMPAFGSKLTDAQIKSVLAYIHTLQK